MVPGVCFGNKFKCRNKATKTKTWSIIFAAPFFYAWIYVIKFYFFVFAIIKIKYSENIIFKAMVKPLPLLYIYIYIFALSFGWRKHTKEEVYHVWTLCVCVINNVYIKLWTIEWTSIYTIPCVHNLIDFFWEIHLTKMSNTNCRYFLFFRVHF